MTADITRIADWKPIKHKGPTKASQNGFAPSEDPARKEKNQAKQEAKVEKFIAASAKEYKKLRILGKKKEYTEKDMGVMLQTMLKMTLKMLPQAQQTYVKWPNNLNAAAYNHLVSQAREISNDLRSIQDLNAQFETIMESVTKSVQLMMRNLVDQSYVAEKELKLMNMKFGKKAARIMKVMLREHAGYASESLKGLHQELSNFLVDRK